MKGKKMMRASPLLRREDGRTHRAGDEGKTSEGAPVMGLSGAEGRAQSQYR
jgi:hypothetical protein